MELFDNINNISKEKDKYLAPYFGFNQLNSITLSMEKIHNKKYLESIKTDMVNIKQYINYGFNKFNYLLAKKIFEYYEPNLLQELRQIKEINEIDENVKKEKTLQMKERCLRKFVNETSKEECKVLCGRFINTFFKKNGLKSEDKKEQIIDGLLYNEEKNKADVNRYIKRFSIDKKEDIFKIILERKNGKEIVEIAKKIEKSKRKIEEYRYNIYDFRKELFREILPQREFTSFQLQDTYEEKDIFEGIDEKNNNVLYINIEYSNHGRKCRQDDYPFIVKEWRKREGCI